MAARPLSQREELPYLVVYGALTALVAALPTTSLNIWDGLTGVWSILLAIFGTIYIYRQNGGANGHFFLQRYLAVGWVVAVRYLAVLVPIAIVFFALLVADNASEVTTGGEFIFSAVAETIIYWRIAHHVRDLARKTTAL